MIDGCPLSSPDCLLDHVSVFEARIDSHKSCGSSRSVNESVFMDEGCRAWFLDQLLIFLSGTSAGVPSVDSINTFISCGIGMVIVVLSHNSLSQRSVDHSSCDKGKSREGTSCWVF